MQQYGRHERGPYVRPADEHLAASGHYADWARQSCRGPFGRPSIRHWRNKWVFAIECERGVRHNHRHLVYQHGNNDNGPPGGWRQFPRRQDIRCRRPQGFIRRFGRCKRGAQALIPRGDLSDALRALLELGRFATRGEGASSLPLFFCAMFKCMKCGGEVLSLCLADSAGTCGPAASFAVSPEEPSSKTICLKNKGLDRRHTDPLRPNGPYVSTSPVLPLYYRLIFSPDLILPALKELKTSGPVPTRPFKTV